MEPTSRTPAPLPVAPASQPDALTTADLVAWDKAFLWHPFTPMKAWSQRDDILVIARGQREFLIDTEGRRYIDGVSSLWCNIHGHCVPELDAAVRAQLDQVAHSTLLGLANIPSILLAKRLIELTRAAGLRLDRVFYSDNGSTAVEVACKMAYQYWRNTGSLPPGSPDRSRFIAFDNAYHGDTLGAVSVGGIPIFHRAFKGLCFPVDFIAPPRTASIRAPASPTLAESLQRLADLVAQNPRAHAAIILEPLIQGAGGMITHPPGFLAALHRFADQHDILLIADEVMTGFGRTGAMFACQHDRITPDLLCLSKGLTAGYMPLGATLTTQKVFDAFYADPREGKTFYHGHTFTGHPLACAVALASLDLFAQNHLLDHVRGLQPILAAMLRQATHPWVADARQCGFIGAIDLFDHRTGRPFPAHWRIGGELCRRLRSLGILLRPLADTLVIMPPLAIRPENLQRLCAGVLQCLDWVPDIVAQRTREVPP